MNSLKFLFLFLVIGFTVSKLYTREEFREIKSKATYQTLDYNDYIKIFKERNFDEIRMAGEQMHLDEMTLIADLKIEPTHSRSFLDTNLPNSFDWRLLHPECFIDVIRDQKNCGGCWAFATTAAVSERICIKNKSTETNLYSVQDLLSCDTFNKGCSGGNRYKAWQFIQNRGLVYENCIPFNYQNGVLPSCASTCTQSNIPYTLSKAPTNKVKIFYDHDDIKNDIYLNGPVTAGIQLYADIYTYKTGLYIPTTTEKRERHSVVLVGWGIEAGREYYIVQNSWGQEWGDKGYFKLPLDQCEVNSAVVAAEV